MLSRTGVVYWIAFVCGLLVGQTAASASPAWRSWSDLPTPVDSRSPEQVAAQLVRDAVEPHLDATRVRLQRAAETATKELDKLLDRLDALAPEPPGGGGGRDKSDLDQGPIQKPEAFAINGSNLESIVLSGLVKFAERRAREEAIRIVMERLDHTFCATGRPGRTLFIETCALLSGFRRISGMAPLALLQRAVHRDVAAFPARLLPIVEGLRSKSAVGPLVCGLQLGQRLEHARAGSVAMLVLALSDALLTQDCGEALGFKTRADVDAALSSFRIASVIVAGVLERGETFDAEEVARDARSVLDTASRDLATTFLRTALMSVETHKARLDARLGPELDAARGKASAAALAAIAADEAKIMAPITALVTEIRREIDEVRDARLAPIVSALAPAARSVFPLAQALVERRRASAADRATALGAVLHGGAEVVRALLDVLSAAPGIQGAPQRAALEELVDATADFSAGDFAGGMTALLASGVVPTETEPLRTVLEMSELLLGIAGATSSDEIASVLEATVPAGGWRDKRRRWTYGLSAQFGAAGGLEWARSGSMSMRGSQLEAYLPVGFDVARPLGGGFAGGLLLQVVDLGALSSHRLGGDTVDAPPNVSVSSVFAPGATLYLGLGRTPFVLGVGASYVPGLRTMADRQLDAVRATIAIAIDIPLLTL